MRDMHLRRQVDNAHACTLFAVLRDHGADLLVELRHAGGTIGRYVAQGRDGRFDDGQFDKR